MTRFPLPPQALKNLASALLPQLDQQIAHYIEFAGQSVDIADATAFRLYHQNGVVALAHIEKIEKLLRRAKKDGYFDPEPAPLDTLIANAQRELSSS